MMPRLLASCAAVAAAVAALPAAAAPNAANPVTDCPNRDAPFSVRSPLIDLLLSPAARAVLDRHSPGTFARMPASFVGTTPPSFAAILTANEARRFTRMPEDKLAALDADLRVLPVTDADRTARCARFDNDVPALSRVKGKPNILVFEKINGFKDTPSVDAAHAALRQLAERKGWAIAFTDKGGAFNARTLRQFDAVVWNNVSGDVLTLSQRNAFQRWLANGGGFVGIHGSAGDPVYFWDWYPDTLIGARFAGHPMDPQFQEARIAVNRDHPLAAALPAEWRMTDEWYSFRSNPRAAGANVILSLDESTYTRNGPMEAGLTMGAEHPIAWTNCIGKGRMFYSAIGHLPATYSQPQNVALLEAGIGWAATERRACPAAAR
jgi:type 1 glutamine amidotransferase